MEQIESGVAERGSDLRRMMVDGQIRTFDVTDQRVLGTFYRTPREASLPTGLVPLAYSDAQLVLPGAGPGQAGRPLMQPMFLAKLLQGATLAPTDRVLVVAGASGYAAALIAPLVASTVSLDDDPALSGLATDYLAGLGLTGSVAVVTGALAEGHAAGAPFDRIIVNGGVETGLDPLFAQLVPGGSLLAIEVRSEGGSGRAGKAMRFDKVAGGISGRALFDATIPILQPFRHHAGFVF